MANDKEPMITKLEFNPQQTPLKEAKKIVCFDTQDGIPFLVWFLENPQSPLPFPGQINLDNHDCLHALLGLGVSLADEAVIVGLSMGSDTNTKPWQVKLFKFIAEFFYPEKFRFRREDMPLFDLGFQWGRQLKVKNLNKIDFTVHEDKTVAELREWIGIDEILPLLNSDLTQLNAASSLEEFAFG